MINEKQARWMCCDDITKIYGYNEAVADKENMWNLHHCLGLVYSVEELKKRGLYYKQPAEMLLFCTYKEHQILHAITRKISDETRRRMSNAHINNPKISKRVAQFTKGGELVSEYPSASELYRISGMRPNHILECCNGKRKTAYGYVWRFVD